MVSFALVLFFAVTGITLNHADWLFGSRQRTVQARGQVELKWVKATDPVNVGKLEIVEHLRRVRAEDTLHRLQSAPGFHGGRFEGQRDLFGLA